MNYAVNPGAATTRTVDLWHYAFFFHEPSLIINQLHNDFQKPLLMMV